MFFVAKNESLVRRIALSHIAIFAVTSVAAFVLLDLTLGRTLNGVVDRRLRTELLDLSTMIAGRPPSETAAELQRFGLSRGSANAYARLFDPEGMLLATSLLSAWPDLPTAVPGSRDTLFRWQTFRSDSHPAGIRRLIYRMDDGRQLEIGLDLGETRALIDRFRLLLGGVLGLSLVFATALVWHQTRRSLATVAAISETARTITRDLDFSQRVPEGLRGTRETADLAAAFDTLIDRIALLVRGQKQVADAIAHDIRSPVARMRAAAEIALGEREDPVAAKVVEQCDYILSLVNMLLEISAAETETACWQREPVDLSRLVADALELFDAVAEDSDRCLTGNLEKSVVVAADRRTLQRIVANLIDNAVKYTRPGDSIEVSLSTRGEDICLEVSDTGPGIAEEIIPRVFDRFVRGEASRATQGSGLGLAYCKAAVEAMGGSITCESESGRGTLFRVWLPRSARVTRLPESAQ